MKRLIMILLLAFVTSFTFSQTFFNLITLNVGNDIGQDYKSITESNELGIKYIYTSNLYYGSASNELIVRKYSPDGEFVNEISMILEGYSNISKDTHFHNDTLYVVGTNQFYKPVIYRVSSDMTYIDSTFINVDGHPWRVQFNGTYFRVLCYNYFYQNDVWTKIYDIDYNNLVVTDSITLDYLDPWSFYMDSDTIYLSCGDTSDVTQYGQFHIKKIYDQTIENIISFPYDIQQVYLTLRSDKKIAISARVSTSNNLLAEIYSNDGVLLDTDTIEYNANGNSTVYPVNYLNRVVYAWQHNAKIKMKVLLDDLSALYHTFEKVDTNLMSVNSVYTTSEHIYIYGAWKPIPGQLINPYILKTDELGTFAITGIVSNTVPESKFNFYPNPVTDNIILERLTNDKLERLYIYDISGRLVDEKNIGDSNTINLSFLKPGTYLITMDKYHYMKLLKK